MIRTRATPKGRLDRLIEAFDPARVARKMEAAKREVLEELTQAYLRALHLAIESGAVGGPPLAASTESRKGHGRPWIDTGDLKDAITIRTLQNGVRRVGIPMNAKNRRGQQLDLIAMILEIGSYHTPARPLFEPTAHRVAQNASLEKSVRSIIVRHLPF